MSNRDKNGGRFRRRCSNEKHDEWAAFYGTREFGRTPVKKYRKDILKCFQALSTITTITPSSYFCPGCLKFADERPEIRNQSCYRGKTKQEQKHSDIIQKLLIPISTDRIVKTESAEQQTITYNDRSSTNITCNDSLNTEPANNYEEKILTDPSDEYLHNLLPSPVKKLKLQQTTTTDLASMSNEQLIAHV